MLIEARNYKQRAPKGVAFPASSKLLLPYALRVSNRVDVHGGYFNAVAQRLIYRLACLGFQGAAHTYGDEGRC